MVEWNDFARKYADKCRNHDVISEELFDQYGVKRGLRDKNGAGVVTGLTNISRIDAFKMKDGKKIPCDGELRYRGYNIYDLVEGIHGRRYGYEEIAYLILFGELPSEADLNFFIDILSRCRRLPTNFTRDVIMKGPTGDLMNSMTRSVLTLASYVDNPHDTSLENVLIQCIQLISEFPMLAVYSYHAYNHYVRDDSLYIHRPDPNLSTAENILMMLRPDKKFTAVEAMVLDIALILHMEHGGGNNSTFTTRVVTSAGSDTYSVIAAALSSLKGPRHGGANAKVVEMMRHIRANVSDITDEDAVRDYLGRILMGEAFDGKGLIYGMGHAIYSKSDPRANIFRSFVKRLAEEKDRKDVFDFYSMVERLAPQVIADKRRIYKGVSANVDFYSGFVYSMLDIPVELFTPMFAMARIVGWSAHRLEELVNADKIIRPAYSSVVTDRDYIPMEERKDTHV
jgi:citrate synthase